MDSFKGYLVPFVKDNLFEKNTNITIISGGLTSKVQPLDISINKSFKAKGHFLFFFNVFLLFLFFLNIK